MTLLFFLFTQMIRLAACVGWAAIIFRPRLDVSRRHTICGYILLAGLLVIVLDLMAMAAWGQSVTQLLIDLFWTGGALLGRWTSKMQLREPAAKTEVKDD